MEKGIFSLFEGGERGVKPRAIFWVLLTVGKVGKRRAN